MANGTVYSTEQTGILNADKVLIGISAAMLPAIIALFSLQSAPEAAANVWLSICVALVIPSLFTLLWHSVRWPVRLQLMRERTTEAGKKLSDDIAHIFDTVAMPRVKVAIFGEGDSNVVKGPDGKEYVRGPMKEIRKKMAESLSSTMKSDNPIVSNAIEVHSRKMYEAQRSALVGKLEERFARLKQAIDFISRHTRHWWFFGMAVSGVIGLMVILK